MRLAADHKVGGSFDLCIFNFTLSNPALLLLFGCGFKTADHIYTKFSIEYIVGHIDM